MSAADDVFSTGMYTTGPVQTVADLLKLRNSFFEGTESAPEAAWAFRGQPRIFGTLSPSLKRQFPKPTVEAAQVIERHLLMTFREQYESLSVRSDDMPHPDSLGAGHDLRCLSVMQHYEIPTRLLDWTSNFWIALYFACASEPDDDAELWAYNRSFFVRQREMNTSLHALMDHSDLPAPEPKLLNGQAEQLLVELDPRNSPRLKEQAGHHTVSSEVLADQVGLFTKLRNELDDKRRSLILRRILIDKSCKSNVIEHLEAEERITASSVFPDVVGLSRFIRWRLDAMRRRLL
jgi:FRG domain